jgi:hypothetical protein
VAINSKAGVCGGKFSRRLDQIQTPFRRASAITFQTDSANDQRVTGKLELILRSHLAKGRFDGWMLKLDHLPALRADEMLVLRVSIIVLKKRACPKVEPPQKTSIHELGQGPIDGGTADIEPSGLQVVDQLIGVEMMMTRKNVLDKFALLVGKPLGARPTGQILAELFFGGLRYVYGRKRQRTNSFEFYCLSIIIRFGRQID